MPSALTSVDTSSLLLVNLDFLSHKEAKQYVYVAHRSYQSTFYVQNSSGCKLEDV